MEAIKSALWEKGKIPLDVLCGGECEACKNPFEGTKRVITDLLIDVHNVAFCSVACHLAWLGANNLSKGE